MNLRPYQESAIRKLRRKIESGLKRVVLVAATGSGKTRTAAEVIRLATSKGFRVAFICNRIELVKQAVEAFEKLGIKCGIMQGENSWDCNAQVVVCSIQTMARRKYNGFDLALIDECHTTPQSKAYRKFFESHSNIPIVGLTATPWAKGMAAKHKWLHDEPIWQDLVVAASIPDLIAQGFLVDVEVYAPTDPDLSGVSVQNGDYEKRALAMAMNKAKLVGDIVKHYIRLGEGKPAVCFCVNVKHSMHVVEEFNKAGIRAVHVDGYMKDEDRRPLIEAFKRGEYQVLSNCHLLAEGFDAPSTEVCILARPTKSLIRFIQCVGRALRPFPGKTRALILDHSGVVQRLGWPTDELPYDLDSDDKKKESKEAEKPLPIVCPSCYAVRPRSVKKCNVCGFEPVATAKPQLVEAGELEKMERKKAKEFSMEDKQAIYSALLAHVRSKGQKEGAAYHKFKDIVGVYPCNSLEKKEGPMIESVEKWLIHERIKWANSKQNFLRKAA